MIGIFSQEIFEQWFGILPYAMLYGLILAVLRYHVFPKFLSRHPDAFYLVTIVPLMTFATIWMNSVFPLGLAYPFVYLAFLFLIMMPLKDNKESLKS